MKVNAFVHRTQTLSQNERGERKGDSLIIIDFPAPDPAINSWKGKIW